MQKYNLTIEQNNLLSFRMTEELALTSTDDINNKEYMKELEQHNINLVKDKSDKQCIIQLERELLSNHETETLEAEALQLVLKNQSNDINILFSQKDIENQMNEILYERAEYIRK